MGRPRELAQALQRRFGPLFVRMPKPVRHLLIWMAAPKVVASVSGVVLNARGEMLLLCHRFRAEHSWGLPGGFIGRAEHPSEALRRELREETGLVVEVGDVLAVDRVGGQIQLCYVCRLADGVVRLQRSEVTDYRWIAPSACTDPLERCHAEAVKVLLRRREGDDERA